MAAPPAKPVKPSMVHRAALEMGRVSTIPTITETRMPIKKGCISVARITRAPNPYIMALTPGPTRAATAQPKRMVTVGVTRISTLVSLETALPSSAATMAAKRVPRGPPRLLAAAPTAHKQNSTRDGACKA